MTGEAEGSALDLAARRLERAVAMLESRMAEKMAVAGAEAARIFGPTPGLELVDSAMAAVQGADALLIATEWREFRTPDFEALKAALKQPLVLDGRNLYEPALMQALGIDYLGVGRGALRPV